MKINGECLLLVWYKNLAAGLKVDWNYACPLCHAMNLMSRKFGLKKLLDLAALSMITVQKQWKLNAVYGVFLQVLASMWCRTYSKWA